MKKNAKGTKKPLTPEDCDVRAMKWFPLHHKDLLDSTWWRRASDLARSRSVNLWAHAYQRVPAASLPNDDHDLADYAGFGRDVDAWLRVKDEIMAPWVLCSDDRYYHPKLAEVALSVWSENEGNRRRWREKKSRQRQSDVPGVSPGDTSKKAGGHSVKRILEKESEINDSPSNEGKRVRVESGKGTRIPFGWTASQSQRDYALSKGAYSDQQLNDLEDNFYDYWKAKAGKDGLAANWNSRWQKWVRNDIEWNGAPDGRQPPRPRGGPPGGGWQDQRRDDLRELAEAGRAAIGLRNGRT